MRDVQLLQVNEVAQVLRKTAELVVIQFKKLEVGESSESGGQGG